MKQLLSKQLAAALLGSPMLIAVPQAGGAQVETAIAIVGLTSSLLAAGSHAGNPQMTAILAEMRMIEALHERLDQVENSLAFIITQLVNIKADVRAELDRDRDITRMETVFGKIRNIQIKIADLAAAKQTQDSEEAAKLRLELDFRIDNLREERYALENRSDFVLPILIAAMVAEVNAMEAVGEKSDKIRKMLEEYDLRIASMQLRERGGSLTNFRESMEQSQRVLGAEIAKLVQGPGNTILSENVYPWYTHTLTHNVFEKGKVVPCEGGANI